MKFVDLNTWYKNANYQHTVMVCMIISLLAMISVFKFWPIDYIETEPTVYVEPSQEIFIEQSIATKQDAAPASPPKPQIPIPVPTEEVIDEEIEFLDFEDMLSIDEVGINEIGQTGDSDEVVSSPQRAPTPLRIIEPTMPVEARNEGIVAEVFVTFLVDSKGIVEEIFISSIRKYDKKGEKYEIVKEIGYGIMGVSLEAAQQWRFNPARDNGKAVKAYSTQVFSFGF